MKKFHFLFLNITALSLFSCKGNFLADTPSTEKFSDRLKGQESTHRNLASNTASTRDSLINKSGPATFSREIRVSRVSSKPCTGVNSNALDIFTTYARDKTLESQSVSSSEVGRLLGMARFESGGGRGANASNITHHNEEQDKTNRAGDDGDSVARFANVKSYLARYKVDFQTNFGIMNISPDQVSGRPSVANLIKSFLGKAKSDGQLLKSCLADVAYAAEDHSLVKNSLAQIRSNLPKFDTWIKSIRSFNNSKNTSKNRIRCRNDAGCEEASENIGTLLAFCPRLNIEIGAMVRKYGYFGTSSAVKCEDQISAAISDAKSNPSRNIAETRADAYYDDAI